MKDDFIYKEGTTPWFILAGIAFILYPVIFLSGQFSPVLIVLIFKFRNAGELFTAQNLPACLGNIFSVLLIAIASLFIVIGCFTKGRLVRISGVGFILMGIIHFLSRFMLNLFQIIAIAKESLSMIYPRLLASYFTQLFGTFFLSLIFLFMGLNCLYRLKQRTANIVSGILLILYEAVSVCIVFFSRLVSILSLIRYTSVWNTAWNNTTLSTLSYNLSFVLFSFITAIVLIVGCGALFFFAGRTEWLPCPEEAEEFTS